MASALEGTKVPETPTGGEGGGATGEASGRVRTEETGSSGGRRRGRMTQNEEDDWELLDVDDEVASGMGVVAPCEFDAIPLTGFERVTRVIVGGGNLRKEIWEKFMFMNAGLVQAETSLLQEQYSHVEARICEKALQNTVASVRAQKEALNNRKALVVRNLETVVGAVNASKAEENRLGEAMRTFAELDVDEMEG